MNNTIRMRFAKTGRSRYISHLDLIRCLQRAVCRAGLPAAYSGGFHPHMQTSFAATLPLGFTSTAEILELGLTEDVPGSKVMERLNAVLPEDIRILEAGAPRFAFKELTHALYTVELPCDDPAQIRADLEQFLAQPEILVQKKTKKGMKEIDLKPMTEVTDIREETGCLVLELCLPAGSAANLNPMLLLDAWQNPTGNTVKSPKICRTALLTAERSKFF